MARHLAGRSTGGVLTVRRLCSLFAPGWVPGYNTWWWGDRPLPPTRPSRNRGDTEDIYNDNQMKAGCCRKSRGKRRARGHTTRCGGRRQARHSCGTNGT